MPSLDLTVPPTLPSLNDPAQFNTRALALFNWLATLVGELETVNADAFFDVQSSAYDDIAGKVLQVGAFGLGSISSIAETDLDAYPQGFAVTPLGNTLTNKPPSFTTSERAVVLTIGDAGALMQLLLTRTNQRLYIRGGTNNLSEGTWAEIYGQRSVLGTVSQSGGVPTGKLIERGSNANGEYVRFADGTQWCSSIELYDGEVSAGDKTQQTWTFPAAFAPNTSRVVPLAGARSGTVSVQSSAAAFFTMAAQQGQSTSSTITAQNQNTSIGRPISLVAVAHGRWF